MGGSINIICQCDSGRSERQEGRTARPQAWNYEVETILFYFMTVLC
jgi:hypothetical protein